MKNSCRVTFEGLNFTRLLALLNKNGIPVGNVSRRGKLCTIEVPSARSEQTLAILRERCYNIIGIEFFGMPKAAKFVKKHFVLPLICLLAVLVLAVSSQFCLRIETVGDFEREAVCAALNEVGVSVGTNLHSLNLNDVQNKLANKLDAMYAVVTRSGSVLYVNAVAKKEIAPPIDLDERRDIVAERSGVVANIVCEQGTPLVQKGDSVRKGDVLIAGRRTFNDGVSEDVYALGRVTLTVCETGFAPFDGLKTVTAETGNVFECTGVVLFGKQYAADCPFESYTVSTVVTRLFPLNLAIVRNVYRETVSSRVPATIEECVERLRTEAFCRAMELCDFAVVETVYETAENGVYARCYGEIHIQ